VSPTPSCSTRACAQPRSRLERALMTPRLHLRSSSPRTHADSRESRRPPPFPARRSIPDAQFVSAGLPVFLFVSASSSAAAKGATLFSYKNQAPLFGCQECLA
jgi:hypothetical protein